MAPRRAFLRRSRGTTGPEGHQAMAEDSDIDELDRVLREEAEVEAEAFAKHQKAEAHLSI